MVFEENNDKVYSSLVKCKINEYYLEDYIMEKNSFGTDFLWFLIGAWIGYILALITYLN